MTYILSKSWKEEKNTCVILERATHFCGYVGINKEHPLYKVEYKEHSELLAKFFDKKTPVGSRGIISLFCFNEKRIDPEIFFDVHGSITYSGGFNNYPIHDNNDLWWFGFDCAHVCDTKENCDEKFCIKECEKLSKQLTLLERKTNALSKLR